jgi:hypothetical protein
MIKIASRYRKSGRMWKLLYGDDEGVISMRWGSVEYWFETDKFTVRDLNGNKLYGTDDGSAVERWFEREGWG